MRHFPGWLVEVVGGDCGEWWNVYFEFGGDGAVDAKLVKERGDVFEEGGAEGGLEGWEFVEVV